MHIPTEFYENIVRSMPIPCVDLLVKDTAGQILLLRRQNPPAQGHWWLPGGRVHFGERRELAARRKLREECALAATVVRERGTFDLFLDDGAAHSITTLFEIEVSSTLVQLDKQSQHFAWRPVGDWLAEVLHPFVIKALTHSFLAPQHSE